MPDDSPLVSALIPTYRRQHVLERSIRSILAQTIDDLEVVVVDDEPSPLTRKIVESIDDPRVRYVAHPENRGLAASRTTGVREARGRFVAFNDDDDEWAPEKLEKQLQAMHAHGDDVVVHSYERWIKPDGSERIRRIHLDGDVHRELLETDMVLMQTLLVPRRAFDEVGEFDAELTNYMDMDMNIRLSRRFRYVTVPEPLFIGHVTPGSLSRSETGRIRALERILGKYPEYQRDRRLRSRWEYRLARKYGAIGDRRGWRRKLLNALRLDPVNGRAWAMLGLGLVTGPGTHHRVSSTWSHWVNRFRGRSTGWVS